MDTIVNRTCHYIKGKLPELGILEWITFNPDCLIRISNVDTFNFLLNPLFFGYKAQKNQKSVFQNKRVPPVSVY